MSHCGIVAGLDAQLLLWVYLIRGSDVAGGHGHHKLHVTLGSCRAGARSLKSSMQHRPQGRFSPWVLQPILDLCMSSLCKDHSNLHCNDPILTDVSEFLLDTDCLAYVHSCQHPKIHKLQLHL